MLKPIFLRDRRIELLLFGGKGGVGKTSCATASAVYLALDRPEASFLLVSTDPAHSLADSLAGSAPPSNLEILELNAHESLVKFKEKHGWKLREMAVRGTFLDAADTQQLLELSLPGLDELMAFLEISSWVKNRSYSCIVVDTAPTGHTLRLLEMPKVIRNWLGALDALLAKHRYMKMVFSRSDQRDDLDGFLEELNASIERTEALLQDRVHCCFVPVMLAETMSVCETLTLVTMLKRLKVPVTDVVINRIHPDNICPICTDGRGRQMKELKALYSNGALSKSVLWGVPLHATEVRGLESLNAFWESAERINGRAPDSAKAPAVPRLRVEAAAEAPPHGATLLLFAGKGGVGKTTLSCATAVRLAEDLQGKEVLLFSTDSAHSLSACLDLPIGPIPRRILPGLTAVEIDAQAEFEDLKAKYGQALKTFLESVLQNVDLTFDREVMERILDLSPPGMDEVMALTQVMDFMAQRRFDVFVLDSAPTGHLVRLLELPKLMDQWMKTFFGLFLKYKTVFRLPGLSQRMVGMSKNLKRLRTLLADPDKAALYAVTIPTEMAFEETKDLMTDCDRLKIKVPVMFLNLATPDGKCPVCAPVHAREVLLRKRFQKTFSGQHHTLIYCEGELRGIKRLETLGRLLYQPARKESVA